MSGSTVLSDMPVASGRVTSGPGSLVRRSARPWIASTPASSPSATSPDAVRTCHFGAADTSDTSTAPFPSTTKPVVATA